MGVGVWVGALEEAGPLVDRTKLLLELKVLDVFGALVAVKPANDEAKVLSPLCSLFSGDFGFGMAESLFVREVVARRVVALSPTARSLRCEKFLGLRPRTTMAADLTSAIETLSPVDKVATSFSLATKCCCSSFRRPLFAVAIRNWRRFHAMGKVA